MFDQLAIKEKMKVFDNCPPWSYATTAVTLFNDYITDHKTLSTTMQYHCAHAFVYWAGVAEGIRQERARRKQTAAVKLTVPPEIEHRIVELQKQERFRNMSTADLARHLVTLALMTDHQ